MKRTVAALTLASTVVVGTGSMAADLGVGSQVPPLHIGTWVRGDPVDMSKAKSNAVYVVAFWATWSGSCLRSIPHVSEMRDHFKDKGVTVIGVSDEAPGDLEKFLTCGWDKRIRYRIASDEDRKTNVAWMAAAGQPRIPIAFVVKGGTIRWIGHPMSGLDIAVAELCGDQSYARRAREIQDLRTEIETHQAAGRFKKAVASVDSLLALRPNDAQAMLIKHSLLATKLKDAPAAAKFGYTIVTKCADPYALNELAWNLLAEDEYADARDVELAKASAKKACELTKHRDASTLDTYARALADSGDLAVAIEWQKKAVEACKYPGPALQNQIEDTLKEYQARAR